MLEESKNKSESSGIKAYAIIPAGTKNLKLHLYDHGANDTIEIFTKNDNHIVETKIEE